MIGLIPHETGEANDARKYYPIQMVVVLHMNNLYNKLFKLLLYYKIGDYHEFEFNININLSQFSSDYNW